MSLYLFFVAIAITAIVVVCLVLVALGSFGTLWLIGQGYVEVKVAKEQEDAGQGTEEAVVDRTVAQQHALSEGQPRRAHAGTRGIRLHPARGRGDHVS